MTREQLDSLANRIAELSLRIDLAKHAMFAHLREFDAHDGWANSGFTSTASWLAWRIDIGPVAAREHVRVAQALGELRRVDAAFASGELSYSKVRAITRVATAEIEQDFLDIAKHATASQIEKIARAYRRTRVDPEAPALDLRRFVRRAETRSGMIRIEMQLPPEQANVVWEALSAALDAGRREVASAESEPVAIPRVPALPQKRRANGSTRSFSRPSAPTRWSASRRRTSSTMNPARSGAVTSSSS